MKNGINQKCKIFALFSFLFVVYLVNIDYEGGNNQNLLIDFYDEEQNFSQSALSTEDLLKSLLKCNDTEFKTEIKNHGNYLILQNFIRSRLYFNCHQSITYVTHSDFTYLDNIIPLIERWEAPISVAVYAPGSDFDSTLKVIFYLRNCIEEKELVKDFVTFHIFFEREFYHKNVPESFKEAEKVLNCSENYLQNSSEKTFKAENNLKYPVNVARNLARNSSMTHLLLVSDIELYPSIKFVESFFKLIVKFSRKINLNRNVFVFPIFEVEADEEAPRNKSELKTLYDAKKAFWFHYNICPTCHEIPNSKEWLEENENDMKVASSNKRTGAFYHWEPLYVGSKNEPLYDERLYWEGKSDKMTQAYIMCLLDYNFNILSNAFLVHRPGVKKVQEARRPFLENTVKKFISKEILPEIRKKYGNNKDCKIN